jgi:hypothetical protein
MIYQIRRLSHSSCGRDPIEFSVVGLHFFYLNLFSLITFIGCGQLSENHDHSAHTECWANLPGQTIWVYFSKCSMFLVVYIILLIAVILNILTMPFSVTVNSNFRESKHQRLMPQAEKLLTLIPFFKFLFKSHAPSHFSCL